MSNALDVVTGVKKLEDARKDCIAALREKEVEVADSMKWSELAGLIEGIEGQKKANITINSSDNGKALYISKGGNYVYSNANVTFPIQFSVTELGNYYLYSSAAGMPAMYSWSPDTINISEFKDYSFTIKMQGAVAS